MKKHLVLLVGFVVYCATPVYCKSGNTPVQVRVCKAVEHEALNAVVEGMRDYLSRKNKKQGKKYVVSTETCQGNMALAAQIIEKFVHSTTDVVVTVGTGPTQCAFKLAKEKKIALVFSSVTNPDNVSSNLSGSNTTGVSNFVPLEPQIELFKELLPNLKNLGILYNPGEANAVCIVERLEKICPQYGIVLVKQAGSRIADIPQSVKSLAKKVEAVFISNDNLALSAMANVVAICNIAKIPVFVSDTDQVEKGCLAALGPNQYDIGLQTGEIVERVACGEDINTIDVEYPRKSELYLNVKAAQLLAISIPDHLKAKAKKLIGEE
ncbi:MAG: ABC transporter substrate-binding protein [Holosporales bacterium]|jgi:putative ABC transport system substrate-binding protein|nr:ABC transporter substrate-binding protein [Holosporales bacterium]